MSLPAADDLFRPTAPGHTPGHGSGHEQDREPAGESTAEADLAPEPRQPEPEPETGRKPSGRVRHDEKMTVYVTSEELLQIEHARLTLRRHGVAVDRGRLVREAVALVLAELEEHGSDSGLVRRLSEG